MPTSTRRLVALSLCLASCGTGLTPSPPTPAQGGSTTPVPAPQGDAAGAPVATLSGPVAGKLLQPLAALYAVGLGPDGVPELDVKIVDDPNACDRVGKLAHRPNSLSLWLRAVAADGTFAGHTFNLRQDAASNGGTATFYALGPQCEPLLRGGVAARSGKLTLTDMGSQSLSGTFEALLGKPGDSLTGTFNATLCPALAVFIRHPDVEQVCQ